MSNEIISERINTKIIWLDFIIWVEEFRKNLVTIFVFRQYKLCHLNTCKLRARGNSTCIRGLSSILNMTRVHGIFAVYAASTHHRWWHDLGQSSRPKPLGEPQKRVVFNYNDSVTIAATKKII